MAVLPRTDLSSSFWGLVASVALQSLLVWRLSLGSGTAWTIGLLTALLGVSWIVLMAAPLDATTVLLVLGFLAQAGVLLAPPLRTLARSRRQIPPAAA